MNFKTVPYTEYEKDLPQKGNFILGQEENDSIVVYQAYNHLIADFALQNQRFGGNAYSFSRMSWIKPNFLWMMYRSGWAKKPNQERILAITMSKTGFISLLQEGVYSSFKVDKYENQEAWKNYLANSEVRIQWDPDHDPKGEKMNRRAIQIGIKGKRLMQFNNEFIEQISDITEFVIKQRKNLQEKKDVLLVMEETIIEIPNALKEKYSIPNTSQQAL